MERSSSSSSNGVGLLAACAVSWSVAFFAFHAHKRMLSDFVKKMELELNGSSEKDVISCKKKVRFAEDVMEPSSNNKEYRQSRRSSSRRSSSLKNTISRERSSNEAAPQNEGIVRTV